MVSGTNHFHTPAESELLMDDELSALVGSIQYPSVHGHILNHDLIPEDPTMQFSTSNFDVQQYTDVMNFGQTGGSNDLLRVVTGGITTDRNHINKRAIVHASTINDCTTTPLTSSEQAPVQEKLDEPPKAKRGRKLGSGKGVQKKPPKKMPKKKERLSQTFCDLRAVVPNSSKMDEASLIANAASYIKDLMSKVQALEMQALEMQVSVAAAGGGSGCRCRVNGISVDVVEHQREVVIQIDCGKCNHWTVRMARLGAVLREMGIHVKSVDTQCVEEQMYVRGTAVMERRTYSREQIMAALQENV